MARRALLRVVLPLLALAWVPVAVFAAVDVDRWWPIPSAVAFLPYVLGLVASAAVVAALARARLALLVALVGVAVLLVPRLSRLWGDSQPAATGQTLTVATSNVLLGHADAAALDRVAAQRGVDVLAVQEDTPAFDRALRRTDLARRLPYSVARPGSHAAGLSVFSRYPVTAVPGAPGDTRSAGGVMTLPGGASLHVRSVHPYPPFSNVRMRQWAATTRAVSRTVRSRPARPLLLGDFNATLDHHPLRSLIAQARLRDAAEQRGVAWRPTWGDGRGKVLTLDHVLVPPGVAVRDVDIIDLSTSDHHVVVAKLILPG